MNITPEFASTLGRRPPARAPAPPSSRDWRTRSSSRGRWPARARAAAPAEVAEAVEGRAPAFLNTGAQGGQHRVVRALHRGRHRRQRPQATTAKRGARSRASASALPGGGGAPSGPGAARPRSSGRPRVKAVVLDPACGLPRLPTRTNAWAPPRREPGWSEAGRREPGSATRSRLIPTRLRCGGHRSVGRRMPSAWPAACPASVLLGADDLRYARAALQRRARARARSTSYTPSSWRARAHAHRRGHHAAVRRARAALASAPRAGSVGAHASCGGVVRLARRATRGSRVTANATGRSRAASTTSSPRPSRPICAHRRAWDAPVRPHSDPAEVIGCLSAAIAGRTGLRAGIPVVAGFGRSRVIGASGRGSPITATCSSSWAARSTCSPAATARCWTRASISMRIPRPGLWLPNGCMASGGSGLRWFQRELAGGEALGVSTRRRRRPRPAPTARDAALPARREDADQRSAGTRRVRRPAGRARRGTSFAPCSRASPTACATTSRCWTSTACGPHARA